MVLLVVCLVLMTIAWPVAVWQMVRHWRHQTTFFDVREGPNFRYRQARVRAMPVVVGAGGPFLAAGWISC